MPRKHKHVPGTAFRRNYPENNIELALRAVLENQMSFGQAAATYRVPKTTLYNKYRGNHSDKLGRPGVLTNAEEKTIAQAMMVFGYPFTDRTIKEFVQLYLNRKGVVVPCFSDNTPGNDWLSAFSQRNPELTQRNAENIKRQRAAVGPEIINDFFDHLEVTMENVPSANIINYDETNFTDDPGKQKVYIRRGSKHARRILDSSKTSTSVMFAASADGILLPLYVVYKAKNLYPEWIAGGPSSTRYNRSTSGWFDGEILEDWFLHVALPYLRRKDGKKIVIGDNLASHLSANRIRHCEENNIAFVFLPPNSTHLCQPLDVAIFHPVKIAWRKILLSWKLKNKGVLPKTEFPTMLQKLLNELGPNVPDNIKSGFSGSGMLPLNRQKVLGKLIPSGHESVNEEALNNSFVEIMNKQTAVSATPPKTRKKKINVPAGKSISSVDLESEETDPQPGSSNDPTQILSETEE
jgi:hypothetical protein